MHRGRRHYCCQNSTAVARGCHRPSKLQHHAIHVDGQGWRPLAPLNRLVNCRPNDGRNEARSETGQGGYGQAQCTIAQRLAPDSQLFRYICCLVSHLLAGALLYCFKTDCFPSYDSRLANHPRSRLLPTVWRSILSQPDCCLDDIRPRQNYRFLLPEVRQRSGLSIFKISVLFLPSLDTVLVS